MVSVDLRRAVADAEVQLHDAVDQAPDHLAHRMKDWLALVFDGAGIADVFLRADAFPMILTPWWLGESLGNNDVDLHTQLTYSTINGYLYVRLMDNVMDADGPGDAGLLPALSFFHLEFSEPYRRLLPDNEAFWKDLGRIWTGAADATMRDVELDSIDRATFETVASRKTSAAAIPVAAVAYLRGTGELLEPWRAFIDSFGRWHQMLNDVAGALKDLEHGTATYFLSEGRRREPDSMIRWVTGEGLEWGMSALADFMAEARRDALRLRWPPVAEYLDEREAALAESYRAVRDRWEAVRRVGEILTS